MNNPISEAVEQVGKVIRKPEEEGNEVQAESTSVSSVAKLMVWIVIITAFIGGVTFIVLAELTRSFSWRAVKEYMNFMGVFAKAFVPLILMVGIGRAFKHSKWSKDL